MKSEHEKEALEESVLLMPLYSRILSPFILSSINQIKQTFLILENIWGLLVSPPVKKYKQATITILFYMLLNIAGLFNPKPCLSRL